MFHGPVRAPEEAGPGRARVTISFETWTLASVAPTTITLPVVAGSSR